MIAFRGFLYFRDILASLVNCGCDPSQQILFQTLLVYMFLVKCSFNDVQDKSSGSLWTRDTKQIAQQLPILQSSLLLNSKQNDLAGLSLNRNFHSERKLVKSRLSVFMRIGRWFLRCSDPVLSGVGVVPPFTGEIARWISEEKICVMTYPFVFISYENRKTWLLKRSKQ